MFILIKIIDFLLRVLCICSPFQLQNPFQASYQSSLACTFWLRYTLHVGMGTWGLPFGNHCDFTVEGIFMDAELVLVCGGSDFFLWFCDSPPHPATRAPGFHSMDCEWQSLSQISSFPSIYRLWPCFEQGPRIIGLGGEGEWLSMWCNLFSVCSKPMDAMSRRKQSTVHEGRKGTERPHIMWFWVFWTSYFILPLLAFSSLLPDLSHSFWGLSTRAMGLKHRHASDNWRARYHTDYVASPDFLI